MTRNAGWAAVVLLALILLVLVLDNTPTPVEVTYHQPQFTPSNVYYNKP